jgi:hypothetical protein
MPECDTVAHRPRCGADGVAESSAEAARDGAVVLFCCAEAGTAFIHCRGTAVDDAVWKRVALVAEATAEADAAPEAAGAEAAAAPSPRGGARRRNPLLWTMTCACWTTDGLCVVSAQAGRVPGAKRENTQRQPLPPAVVSIALWRASDGALLRVMRRPEGSGAIHVLAPHPTQAHVVLSGDEGGEVVLSDLARGVTLAHFANRECGGAGALVHDALPPYQPTGGIVAYCEVYDAAWLPNGSGFCATDHAGRLNVYGTGAADAMAGAPIEQYFQSDYKSLDRDLMGVVIDTDTRNPPHLDTQLLCNRVQQPYEVQCAERGGGEATVAATAAFGEERRARVAQARRQRASMESRYAVAKRNHAARAAQHAIEEANTAAHEVELERRFNAVAQQRAGANNEQVLDYASSGDDAREAADEDFVPDEARTRRSRRRSRRARHRPARMMTRNREAAMGEGRRLGSSEEEEEEEEGGDGRSGRNRRAQRYLRRQRGSQSGAASQYEDRGSSAADDDASASSESNDVWSGGDASSSSAEERRPALRRGGRRSGGRSASSAAAAMRAYAANAAPRVATPKVDREWLASSSPPTCVTNYCPQVGDIVAYVAQGHHAWQTSPEALPSASIPAGLEYVSSPWDHFPSGAGGGGRSSGSSGSSGSGWPVVKCSVVGVRYALTEPFVVGPVAKRSVVVLVSLQIDGVSKTSHTTSSGTSRFTTPRIASSDVPPSHPFAPLTECVDGGHFFFLSFFFLLRMFSPPTPASTAQ